MRACGTLRRSLGTRSCNIPWRTAICCPATPPAWSSVWAHSSCHTKGDPMITSRTLAELFTYYLADVRSSQAPSTQYQQGFFFDAVARELGHVRLEDVTPDVLRDWKGRLGLRHKASTVYRYMVLLNCALRFAVECGWLAGNPMAKVRRPSPGRGRARFLT